MLEAARRDVECGVRDFRKDAVYNWPAAGPVRLPDCVVQSTESWEERAGSIP